MPSNSKRPFSYFQSFSGPRGLFPSVVATVSSTTDAERIRAMLASSAWPVGVFMV